MTPTQKRLAALEASIGDRHAHNENTTIGDAIKRLMEGLFNAMPAIDRTGTMPSLLCSHGVVSVGERKSSFDQVLEMGHRAASGSSTDADRAILANMNAADLALSKTTGLSILESLVRLNESC